MIPKKDVNIAVRVSFDTWKNLDLIRADRQVRNNTTTSLSEIVREALEQYVGDTCQKTSN